MKTIRYSKALTENGWMTPAFITLDKQNQLFSLESEYSGEYESRSRWVFPKIPNAHSHAFQYAMAGKAEHLSLGNVEDDFWSWRTQMYDLALTMTPERMKEISLELYREMVEKGYGAVAEFHYLHNDEKGCAYSNRIEMAQALIESAHEAGILITLVPVYYETSNFGQSALEHQRRFTFNGVKDYFSYVEQLKKYVSQLEHASYGVGVHSLRAAPQKVISEIISYANTSDLPFHIHIAEQMKEVNDCLNFYGKRPVDWIFDEFNISSNCHLVHSTHITANEMSKINQSKANVVICPSTEGNLGDGIFPLKDFHEKKGKWCIGSDSHVCRNPFEELRWLDYGQRLVHQKRNPLCSSSGQDSAFELVSSAIKNGRKACGLSEVFFQKGLKLDSSPQSQFIEVEDSLSLSEFVFAFS